MLQSMTKRMALSMVMLAAVFAPCLTTSALGGLVVVNGNGNGGFGGTVGSGQLTLSDDGITLSGTFNRGPGTLNDAVVLFLDTTQGATGFADTFGFTDNTDPLRTAISGTNNVDRTTAYFAPGFLASHAIAFDQGFGGLWSLVAGPAVTTHNYVTSVGLSPTGTPSAAAYTFSVNLSSLGLTPGDELRFVGTYTSTTAYRSDEAFGNILVISPQGPPNPGATGNIEFTNYYSLTTVPEPTSGLLVALSAGFVLIRRRHA